MRTVSRNHHSSVALILYNGCTRIGTTDYCILMILQAARLRCRMNLRVISLLLAANLKALSAFQPLCVRSIHFDSSSSSSSSFDVRSPTHHGRRHHRQEFPRHENFVTSCNLFFRKSDNKSPARRRGKFATEVFDDLKAANLTFPHEIEFADEGYPNEAAEWCDEKLSIRFMTVEDIKFIMPLCIAEFGTGFTLGLVDFPFQDWSQISNWWDRVFFEPSVALSLRSKINANLCTTTEHRPRDPAVMVLCRSVRPSEEQVVGMVEISLQAPEADKNPPPFPIPLWIKALYCRLTGRRLVGWVTNLLIDPRYRGLGYAKILMAATEGIAKSWGCEYVFLHADADYRSGKVPQALYKGLGYEVVTDNGPEYSWMSGGYEKPFSSIRMIEGVPLLCFKKEL